MKMKNKEFKREYPDIIKSGKKVYRLFIPIIFFSFFVHRFWLAYNLNSMNLDSYGDSLIKGSFIIWALGILLAAIGELLYSFKIKRNIGSEISLNYIKNVALRALFWELVLGFLWGASTFILAN